VSQRWPKFRDKSRALPVVRDRVAAELPPGKLFPADDEDLIESGLIDSMGWVGILSGLEDITGVQDFGNPWPPNRPQSVRALAELLCEAPGEDAEAAASRSARSVAPGDSWVNLTGWGYALGRIRVEAAGVESKCALAPGTISGRAGIDTVCYAGQSEDEISLGFDAAEAALAKAGVGPGQVDVLVATSATWIAFPSLAARLHSRLILDESCGAFDVGGACAGVIHALATARAILLTGRKVALVVAAEINSRPLAAAPGEFRGLFGDGACAFILSRSGASTPGECRLGNFISGCSGAHASALRLGLTGVGSVTVEFKGEELVGAAITALDRVIQELEAESGTLRTEVDWFALHQANPRAFRSLANRANIPLVKSPEVTRYTGNLGSATCGVALCKALEKAEADHHGERHKVIFVGAVGPGLLWAGTYISIVTSAAASTGQP